MNDLEYLNAAEAVLARIEAACDTINNTTDADIDVQRTGNMLTLVFANGSHIVINLQKPLHEIWLAAPAGGFHYQHQHGQWQDTRGGTDFFTRLGDCASAQAGMALRF